MIILGLDTSSGYCSAAIWKDGNIISEISINNGTLERLTAEAMEKGLGARWINSQLSIMLDHLVYEDPNAERYCMDNGLPAGEKTQKAPVIP